jgi:hypothetical protein
MYDYDLEEDESLPFFPFFPLEKCETSIHVSKKISIQVFIKRNNYLITTQSNLLVKSHQR